jgi:hypothetical protein
LLPRRDGLLAARRRATNSSSDPSDVAKQQLRQVFR